MRAHLSIAVLFVAGACAGDVATDPTTPAGEDEPDDPAGEEDEEGITCGALTGIADHCGELAPEPGSCLTLVDPAAEGEPNRVALLGVESGELCDVASFTSAYDIADVSSLAWLGQDVYFCGEGEGGGKPLTRVSLTTGEVTVSDLPCLSVAAFEDRLLVLRDIGSRIDAYESFAAVLAGEAEGVTVQECRVRIGASEDRLFSAWSNPTDIDVYAPPNATATTRLVLDGVELDVVGLAGVGAELLVLDAAADRDQLVALDVVTGAVERTVEPTTGPDRLHGLSCACGPQVD